MSNDNKGWAWFGVSEGDAGTDPDDRALSLAFARCFRGDDGERVLTHLSAMTLEQALGPGADDAVLRHLEGQRQLVTHIRAQIERGRGINSK
ncbi:MAG: Bbp19 family protein [Alphaproteobacteria bacterium]